MVVREGKGRELGCPRDARDRYTHILGEYALCSGLTLGQLTRPLMSLHDSQGRAKAIRVINRVNKETLIPGEDFEYITENERDSDVDDPPLRPPASGKCLCAGLNPYFGDGEHRGLIFPKFPYARVLKVCAFDIVFSLPLLPSSSPLLLPPTWSSCAASLSPALSLSLLLSSRSMRLHLLRLRATAPPVCLISGGRGCPQGTQSL